MKEYSKAPWLFLLQDHGFGCNYDCFGTGGILDEIIQFMEACTKIGEIYISYATKAYRSKGVGREMEGTR